MEERILIAAEKLFLDKGFAMTSTADIARDAGCNTALIHYYYRTKTKLFQTIFEQKLRLFAGSFMNIQLENISFIEKVRRVAIAHFEFIRANPKLPFLLLNEMTTNPDSVAGLKKELGETIGSVVAVIQREIDANVEQGIIRHITAVDLMLNIGTLNVMTFLTIPVIEQVEAIDRERFIDNRRDEIVRTIINSLRDE